MRQDSFQTGTIRLIGESEVVPNRQRGSRGRGQRGERGQFRGGFFGQIRSVFTFLFVAAILVFAFCYSPDLQKVIISNLYKWSQTELKSNALRQSAINHENEVNRVLQ